MAKSPKLSHGAALTFVAVAGTVIATVAAAGGGSCMPASANDPTAEAEVAALTAAARDRRLDAGGHHTCVVRSDGRVVCWGSNEGRQLGHDRLPKANAPTVVPEVVDVVEVAAGEAFTCVRDEDMDVYCWGGTRLSLGPVQPLKDSVSIAAAGTTACSVAHSGGVSCWEMDRPKVAPEPVAGIDDAAEVTVGDRHACARTETGKVACWGSNRFGQLGDGRSRFRAAAAEVKDLEHVVAVAAGKSHTCALRFDGRVACWGWGGRGQLGDGVVDEEATFARPVWVDGLTEAVALAAGKAHACAELAGTGGGQRVVCWGDNGEGQLGEGPSLFRPLPTPNGHLSEPVVALAAGSAHACAVVDGGRVRCWGHNATWQLGDKAASRCAEPVEARDVTKAVAVTNGGKHTCALLQDGQVACWGTNGRGQMGDERREVRTRMKVVPKLTEVVAVSAGLNHTCAVRQDKTAVCWGDNRFAQLGDGTRSLKTRPTVVKAAGKDVTAVAAAAKHTCALKEDGSVWCWGRNDVGQIGDGTTRNRSKPRQVKGIDGRAVEIAAYQNRTCARREDGAVLCWGDHKPTARKVADWPDATQITVGVAHVCAREKAGTVACVGNNYSGQLGDGSRIFRPEPFRLTTVKDVAQVVAGKRFTCARKDDGSVTCWGDNHFGQLGYSGTKLSAKPVAIALN